ncbi:MAG: aldose 1-epimerase family protein [Sphingomonas bacterium]|nr:aldose 1-epimerase family protein [Sphingomonas bacterium]MDB5688452.1 aldose 1-epimerase family protein [Sphingomonas bacterium]
MITIRSDRLEASIAPLGAELQTITDRAGRDYLWNGDANWWTGRAPILFPIVGTLAQGRLAVDGSEHAMPKHGFARHSIFHVVEQGEDHATFRLEATAGTRVVYPFEFTLDIRFELAGATLGVTATLANPGVRPLPASFGFHPAFRWPLPGGGDRAEHRLRFAEAEPAPIRRVAPTGLLTPVLHPTPVDGRDLALDDSLFEADAVIFDALASRSVRFGAPDEPGIEVAWQGLPELGVWTKPGAPFLCIEPWQGHSDPQDFDGDFRDKPGVIEVPPGGERRFAMNVTVEAVV